MSIGRSLVLFADCVGKNDLEHYPQRHHGPHKQCIFALVTISTVPRGMLIVPHVNQKTMILGRMTASRQRVGTTTALTRSDCSQIRADVVSPTEFLSPIGSSNMLVDRKVTVFIELPFSHSDPNPS